jgi:hypothetical protein
LPDCGQISYNLRLGSIGPVAQSVEQRIENPCVGGSIPPRATNEIKHLVTNKLQIKMPTLKGWHFYLRLSD